MGQPPLLLENDHLLLWGRWKMKVGMKACLGTGLLEEGQGNQESGVQKMV